MWGIDSINIFAKKKRLAKSFENRRNHIKEKMGIADDVNELKHKESGNKEIQDYIDKIKALEESKTQLEESIVKIRETDKLTIEELNQSLSESNSMLQKLRGSINNAKDDYNANIVYEENVNGKQVLQTVAGLIRSSVIDKENFIHEDNADRINFLINTGYVEKTTLGNRLTIKGKNLWQQVNNK